tara:strand:+ start:12961 stop:14172 length:1212 start_codon:yes stop_codon:yes gene_type:complete
VLPVEEKQLNLEELLGQLPSEVREAAEIGVVRADISSNPEYARKAGTFYADKKCGSDLLVKFELIKGDPEAAITLLGNYSYSVKQAAKVAKEHIGLDRAIMVYLEAIEKEDAPRHHEGIARLYEEKGDNDRANKFYRSAIDGYLRDRQIDRAVNLEKEKGEVRNVIGLYLWAAQNMDEAGNKAAYFWQGAKFAEELDDSLIANELYENALDEKLRDRFVFNGENLIKLAKQVGNDSKLITAYQKADLPVEAIKHAIDTGYNERALEIALLMSIPDKLKEVAKYALSKELPELAIPIYEHGGMDKEVARLLITNGNPSKAIEICNPLIDESIENGLFRDPDYFSIAMDAYQALGNEDDTQKVGQKAIHRFSVLGKFDIAANFATRLGYEELAKTYYKISSLPSE